MSPIIQTGSPEAIARAVQILRGGGLVAFPTETVYGLGADARNGDAVRKIFAAKGRPAGNPLIVHVADLKIARNFATDWPDAALELAEKFWPGPLAMVLPKAAAIVDEVTSHRNTVALRVPNHPVALAMLREFAGPVAAPSANRSMHVSPTTAQHVLDDLAGQVDLILDGGNCAIGIESTVIDMTRFPPMILRPGGILPAEIERAIGKIEIFHGSVDPSKISASPGQHARHYSPKIPAYRFAAGDAINVREQLRRAGERRVVLAIHVSDWIGFTGVIPMPSSPQEYAIRFYATLRQADAADAKEIWIEEPPDEPAWQAVRDRITRATLTLANFHAAKPGDSRL